MVANLVSKSLADALVSEDAERKRRNNAERLDRLKDFRDINEMLTHLADCGTKEREQFLKPWKTHKAVGGVGRKKREDSPILFLIKYEKIKAINHADTSDIKYLQWLFDNAFPEMPKKEADKIIKSIRNILGQARRELGETKKKS